MSAYPSTPLGSCVLRVETWNPLRAAPDEEFRYIDLSAVDQDTKSIAEAREMACAEAPSRARQLVQTGDVLVSTVRPNLNGVARVSMDLDGATASTGFCVLRPDPEKLNGSYLFHWVKSAAFVGDMVNKATGASYPAVSDRIIFESLFPLPPLEEQRRIAAILDQAETLRTQRRAALALQGSLTQSLFLDMFGDPSAEDSKWSQTQLDVVAELVTGYPFRSEEYVGPDEGIKLCRGANVLPGRLDWRDMVCWPHEKVKEAEAFHLRAGDIVMAMDRPWISEGFKLTKVDASDCPMLLVQRVARIRPKSEVTNEYLLAVLSHGAFTRHCKPTETTIPHISPKDIRSFSFPLPPLPLQQTFATRIASIEALKATHRRALAALDALFASLQQRAFAGQL